MKKQNETELLDWKKWQDDLIEELVADGIPIDDALLAQVNEEDSVDEEINSVERQIEQVDEETKQLKAELRDLEDQSGQREGVASTLEKLSLAIETKTRKIADMEKRANAKQFAVPRPPPTTAVAAATPNTMVQEPQPAEVDDTPVNTGGEEALENSVDYDLNVTAANVEEPGPSAQSTPMVMSSLSGSPSLKGLVSTNQVSKMMLASAVHQHVESPIPSRRLTAQSPEVVEVSNVHRQPMMQHSSSELSPHPQHRSPHRNEASPKHQGHQMLEEPPQFHRGPETMYVGSYEEGSRPKIVSNVHRQPMMQHSSSQLSPHPQYRSPHRNEVSPKYQGHQMPEEPPQFHRGPETMISPSRGSYEERSRPKIVTVQSPTFSVNNRSALVSPRSEESTSPVSTSAVLLRSPIMEEVEKEYQKMKKSSQSQEKDSGLGQEASNSGSSFGGFGFGRGFGFSSTKEDSQEEDNNGFGFGGSGGGGFGFSF